MRILCVMTALMTMFLAIAQVQAAPQPSTYPYVFRIQVMLDRVGISPGVIDGHMGANTKRALAKFQRLSKKAQPVVKPVTYYRITATDVAGPFTKIPADIMQTAALPALGYKSLLEALAERFHTTPALLKQLNPDARFTEGEEVTVPNVVAMVMPAVPPKTTATKPTVRRDIVVTVTKSTSVLTVTNASDRLVFYAPVTTGSKHDPLPIGEWKVNGVHYSPIFRYNPSLFWDADPKNTNTTIPAGPNNPVGLVWIGISKKHYGLHGTPEPSTIGSAQSHGCVRLTNWDALKLAGMVKFGTPVLFKE